jgi:hypothetical protein
LQGETLPAIVTVQNQGEFSENVTVNLSCNEIDIDHLTDIEIYSGETINVTMYWNTSDFEKGEYEVAARLDVVPNEIHTSDNTKQALSTVTIIVDGHDLAVKSIEVSNYSRIGVVFKNYGNCLEVFDITIFANATPVISCEFAMGIGCEGSVGFYWNTSGWPRGAYIMSAYIEPLPEELDIADNLLSAGVLVLHVGDVDDNGCVNMIDLYLVSLHFATKLGEPGYNTACDVNSDEAINMLDLYIVSLHYGKP